MSRPTVSARYANQDSAVRTIIVRAGDRFTVSTDPPQPGYEHPRSFGCYREARGYAGGIRLSRSIPIDDRTTDADRERKAS